MNAALQAMARQIADMLDAEDVLWEFVADTISASRDKEPRVRDLATGRPIDQDSGYVLEDVIAALRTAS